MHFRDASLYHHTSDHPTSPGSIGFFSVNGTADLNIVIRTAVISDGKLSVGAGGAITVASKPEDEYAEMRTKAAPLMRAVAVAEGRLLAATI